MAIARSRIAACLLHEGQTSHSSLTIPLQLHDKSTCCISAQSSVVFNLHEVQLMVLDEACARHGFMIKAIDWSLQDIWGIDAPNDSLVLLYDDDFCQILSVVVGGCHKQTVEACLWRSYLFPLMQYFHMTINMRLQSQRDNLLDTGEGKTDSEIRIPSEMIVPGNSLDGLIDAILMIWLISLSVSL